MNIEQAPQRVIIVHHSEIALKKGNRSFFESRLRTNIQRGLKDVPGVDVHVDYGRFLIYLPASADLSNITSRLKNVIGIASFKIAFRGNPDPEILKEQVFEKVKDLQFDSFRVDTRRADKQFPFTSVEINQIVGARIHMAMGKRVDLKHAEFVVNIEIFNKQVFFAVESFPGERGLPVGSSGKVVSMLSAGIDSPVASFRMMKRGCHVIFVHFHSYPFTEKSSYYNAIDLAKKLTVYQNSSKIYLVPLGDIQKEIIIASPAKLRVVMYRRMMFRLAETIAKKEGAGALVTGESLGQVASQTLENIAAISEVLNIPVFRPLIGMEKEEIISTAQYLGTFETSIEPFDDCCSFLIPPRPETKARLDQVLAVEEKMNDWQALLDKALAETEIEHVYFPPS